MENNVEEIQELYQKSNSELFNLIRTNSKLLPIIEEIIIKRGDLDSMLALAEFSNINLEKLEDAFIKIGNPYYIKYLAEKNSSVNSKKLGMALIKIIKDLSNENTEINSENQKNIRSDVIYHIIIQFAMIDDENVKMYEDLIIETGNLDLMVKFLLNIENMNSRDRLCKIVCYSDNEEYKQHILEEFPRFAIKYLDLNNYYIPFYKLRNLIIRESAIDIIDYIEENKQKFSNYKQFIAFLIAGAHKENDFELLSVFNFFEDYVENPFVYLKEDLEQLKKQWKDKYEKVYEKTFM